MDAGNKSEKKMEARRYQLELLNYVMDRNAIIYLPTGAGKTYVAIMALKRFSHQMQDTIENGGKRAIFMCNTVELARQQALELKRCTNLKIGFYVGERDVDNWSRKKWDEEIKSNQPEFFEIFDQKYLNIIPQNDEKRSNLKAFSVRKLMYRREKNVP